MMEFFASIGALTILLGGFYVLLALQANTANRTFYYEKLLKEAYWENYFWSWCQDPSNIPPKTPREKALEKFFTKERINTALKIIQERKG